VMATVCGLRLLQGCLAYINTLMINPEDAATEEANNLIKRIERAAFGALLYAGPPNQALLPPSRRAFSRGPVIGSGRRNLLAVLVTVWGRGRRVTRCSGTG
jgi:hypothetical protein